MVQKKIKKILSLAFVILFLTNSALAKEIISESSIKKNNNIGQTEKEIFGCKWDNNSFELGLKNITSGLYSRSAKLFSKSILDQTIGFQSIWDLTAKADIGDALRSELNIRTKSSWGSPDSIAITSSTSSSLSNSTISSHSHSIKKQIFWLRSGWINVDLNKALSLGTNLNQYLKFGYFGFDLGRGISLGSAFAASPGLLGFYADRAVDQSAPGVLLGGELVKNRLSYDFYNAILKNNSDSFSKITESIYSDRLESYRPNSSRGFGHIDFISAVRLKWLAMNPECGNCGKLTIEPYLMYNRDPEQKVEFSADASSNLTTLGIATDYEGSKFNFGCEFAANFGSQKVKAWDRNKIQVSTDSSGSLIEQYSHVVDADPNVSSNSPSSVVASTANKAIVDAAAKNPAENGNQIGSSGFYNKLDRFRASHKNEYKGWMLVADASRNLIDDKLTIGATFGWATGDENPNKDLNDFGDSHKDSTYQGFVGIQEIYSGKLVNSLFVIGPSLIARPLSSSVNSSLQKSLASNTSGFTNLIYTGGAINWKVNTCSKDVDLTLGLLNYWQDFATKKFNVTTKLSIDEPASRNLGLELNTTVKLKVLKNLKAFLMGGVFIPGQHYDDIAGKPLSSAELSALDLATSENFNKYDNTPVLGTSPAFVLNWGIEYAF